MDKRDKIAVLASVCVVTFLIGIVAADTHTVKINLNPKQEEHLQNKMNNTGKNASLIIDEDVQNLYDNEYTYDLTDKFILLAEELITLNDYKKTIEAIKALENILKEKP